MFCFTFAHARNYRGVSIGFNDMAIEGTFTWLDGSPVDFTDWREGNPDGLPGDGDMARIKKSKGKYYWMDGNTQSTYRFICTSDQCPPGKI